MDRQERKTEQLSSLRHKVKSDVDAKFYQRDQQAAYNALKDKAFSNRNNLVITGIPEGDNANLFSQIA